MSDNLRTTGTDAENINVKSFRLLYQWPLFVVPKDGGTDLKTIKGCVGKTEDALNAEGSGWTRVEPLDYPDFENKKEIKDGEKDPYDGLSPAYGEFLYFHDFVQKFLFPRESDRKNKDNPAFTLFKSTRFKTAECQIEKDLKVDFNVQRHSLHLFPSGIALVTLELSATGSQTLAEVMKTMDLLRRSYVPYFTDKGEGGGVPEMVTLDGCKKVCSRPPTAEQAHKFLNDENRKDPNLRPAIFDHWRALAAPLELLGDGGQWRDLSDERLPFNACISLTSYDFDVKSKDELEKLSKEEKTAYADKMAAADRAALQQISGGDWMRLAEVDGPGNDKFVYNPVFLERLKDQAFYDRFLPHQDSGCNATRHIFSAAHYCVVGAGEFADGYLLDHWRRHYAHLTLIARFEQASLLAISSRISQIAHEYDPDGGETADRKYEDALLDVQKQFSLFEHRFRFTGVSSQIQPTEMFARLRKVMGLDALYGDVKNEVEQAAAQVMALQQTRAADAATRLNQLAAVGLFLALVVGAAGMNLFVGLDYGFAAGGELCDHAMQLLAIVAFMSFVFGGLLWIIPLKQDVFLRRFRWVLTFLAVILALGFFALYLNG